MLLSIVFFCFVCISGSCRGQETKAEVTPQPDSKGPDSNSDTGSCVVPEPPQNGHYSKCSGGGAECVAAARQNVPNSQRLTLTCDSSYQLLGPSSEATVTCNSGQWSHRVPDCLMCGIPLPKDASSSGQQGFPWSASIFRQDKSGKWRSYCLGTLITPEIVITDTRCIVDPNDQWTKVGLGVNKKTYEGHELMKDVKYSIYRETYSGEKFMMELAMLRLQGTVTFTDRIMPACVDWDNTLTISPSSNLHVSAWNNDQDLVTGKGTYIDWSTCKQQELVTESHTVDKDTFCANISGAGATPGENSYGAGTTVEKDGKHYIIGVFTHDPDREINVYSSLTSQNNKDWMTQKLGYKVDESAKAPPPPTAAVSSESSDGSCVAPQRPRNSSYSLCSTPGGAECLALPRQSIPNSQRLTLSCDPGYQLVGQSAAATVTCNSGRWSHHLPECLKCGIPLPKSTSPSGQQGFPWSASVFRQEKGTGKWRSYCLGTLITPGIVLTDTRCIVDPNDQWTKVGLGVNSKTFEGHEVIKDVKTSIYREVFTGEKFLMELALLRLLTDVKITDNVMPACVDWDYTLQLSPSSNLHVSSWIKDQKLVTGKATYIDWSVCKQQELVTESFTVDNDTFCANISGAGATPGEHSYGAGTTVERDGKHYVVGVFTHDPDREINVYTSLISPHNMDWMTQKLGYNIGESSKTPATTPASISNSGSTDGSCVAPEPPHKSSYSLCSTPGGAECLALPRQSVPNSQHLTLTCDPDYQLLGHSMAATITCNSGQWNRPFPECLKCGIPLSKETAASAQQKGFPWSASIFRQEKGTGRWRSYCLGTLITPEIVLSDTRCIVDPNDQWTKVGLGVNSKAYEGHEVIRDVKESIYREVSSGEKFLMELTMLRLLTAVKITDNIMPACVDWDNTLALSASSNLQVSAWIKDQDLVTGTGKYIDWSNCKRQELVTESYTLDKDTFCANISGAGATPGEHSYGAGTTVERDGKHYVVGVFTHDPDRDISVYTSLISQENMDWMTHKLGYNVGQTTKAPPAAKAETSEPTSDSGLCVVPEPPRNSQYSLRPRESVPNSQSISLACDSGYQLLGLNSSATVTCNSGKWSGRVPDCLKCGIPLPKGTSSSGQQGFPWSASIFRQEEGTGEWRSHCLGTLITPDVVLSDTRCIVNPNDQWTKVGLGVNSKTFEGHEVMRDVKESVYREIYADEKFLMELALLRLLTPVKITDNIMPACVDWDNTLQFSTRSTISLSAWVKDKDLVTTEGPYIDWTYCKQQELVTESYTLDQSTFCVNSSAFGFTPGEDNYGAGTTVETDGKHYVVGVFSHDAERQINVYTSLLSTENMDWLTHKLGFINGPATEAPPAETNAVTPAPNSGSGSPDGSCVVPEPPRNSKFSLCSTPGGAECLAAPRQSVPNSQSISVSCDAGYQVFGPISAAKVTCNSGQWSRRAPECKKCGIPLSQSASSSGQQGFPWSASIFRQDSSGTWRSYCLGTLISPNIVLSDTRCVVNPDDQWTKVGLGVKSDTLEGHEIVMDVKRSDYRNVYSGEKFLMEITLMELVGSVKVADNIMPACIDWDKSHTLSTSSNLHTSAGKKGQNLVTGNGTFIDWLVCKEKELATELDTLDKETFCVDISVIGANPGKESYGAGTTVEKDGKHYVVGVLSHDAQRDVNVYTSVISPDNMDWMIQRLG